MRVAIFTVGTHGDAVPVAALGRALRAAGHEVVAATSHDHRALMERHGLAWSELLPSYADEMERARELLGTSQTAGIWLLRRRMAAAAHLWVTQTRRAAQGADLLIGTGLLMSQVASAVGTAIGVPAVHAHFLPLIPTRAFPPPLPPPPRVAMPGLVNLALYKLMRAMVWRACFAPAYAAFRRGLDAAATRQRRGRGAGTPARVLCALSPHLLPPPEDWPRARIRMTGAWALPDDGDPPDPRLRAFVASGDKPVVVGFGSMRLAATESAALTDAVLEGLRLAGRRAVLVTGWGALEVPARAVASDRILVVERSPNAWLFARAACVVHHGGAGTVAAAARAGVPQIVIPFVADQFFWARRLHVLGVSPTVLARKGLTGAALADAIADALDGPAGRAASALAGRMGSENGTEAAIASLEEWGLLRRAG